MTTSFLEIIQLPNGEIVLKRADEDGEPLVNIRFSDESVEHLGGAQLDVAKVMIQAGMQAAAQISESQAKKALAEDGLAQEGAFTSLDSEEGAEPVLH